MCGQASERWRGFHKLVVRPGDGKEEMAELAIIIVMAVLAGAAIVLLGVAVGLVIRQG